MKPRYERKYLISPRTAALLKERVKAVLKPDAHSGGVYRVCNIYFDDMYNSFYNDKMRGALNRDKYRLRWYNDDLSFIRLERKHKEGCLSQKESVPVSKELFELLSAGELHKINETGGVWDNLLMLNRLRLMRPSARFSYIREAYCHDSGDIRITFDTQIAGKGSGIGGILELKYTSYLPEFIAALFTNIYATQTENSKYCMVMDIKTVTVHTLTISGKKRF